MLYKRNPVGHILIWVSILLILLFRPTQVFEVLPFPPTEATQSDHEYQGRSLESFLPEVAVWVEVAMNSNKYQICQILFSAQVV